MARAVEIFEKRRASLRDNTIRSLSFSHFNAGEMPRGGNVIMYKGCKYFLLLAAVILGLGMLGGANEAGAAQVTEVRITTPRAPTYLDSGEVRGIDSLIVAEVDVFDVPSSGDLTVAMWLITATDSTVVTEATSVLVDYKGGDDGDERQEVEPSADDDDDGVSDVDRIAALRADIAQAAGPLTDASRGALSETGRGPVGGAVGLVAVRKEKNDTDDKIDSKDFIGNADSVATKAITNGTRFTWYLKVSPQLAEVTKVRVAAVAYRDPDGTSATDRVGEDDAGTANVDESPVVGSSPKKHQFNVDGDRPPNPTPGTVPGSDPPVAISPFGDLAGAQNTGYNSELITDDLTDNEARLLLYGKLKTTLNPGVAGSPGPPIVAAVPAETDDNTQLAITSTKRRKGRTVTGFYRGLPTQVLGPGDSLRLQLNLGDDATTVLLGNWTR